ncbi:MAG: hypothetical protein ARM1_0550 [Candidatus Micrarchaeota archaeon]|nr:MAG: hypothetical protein ARM1_0550 [Candidatus Micrarchaeota archaeon]
MNVNTSKVIKYILPINSKNYIDNEIEKIRIIIENFIKSKINVSKSENIDIPVLPYEDNNQLEAASKLNRIIDISRKPIILATDLRISQFDIRIDDQSVMHKSEYLKENEYIKEVLKYGSTYGNIERIVRIDYSEDKTYLAIIRNINKDSDDNVFNGLIVDTENNINIAQIFTELIEVINRYKKGKKIV